MEKRKAMEFKPVLRLELKGMGEFAEYHQEAAQVNELISKLVEAQAVKINNELESIVRNFSVPPIKGKITEGKIKWRGLRMKSHMEIGKCVYYIEQRGVQIGYKVLSKIEF